MPSIDDRIVKIEFDNAEFEREIGNTLASLADLNNGLQLDGAEDGALALAGIGSAVDGIASRFSAMGAIAFTVIQSLTQGALGLIKKIGGDVLEPIFSGGLNRAKNIEQAKFLFEGLGINIEAAMASALAAVKGTAFGLDEAAKAAAQFGASGIAVGDDMTSALRGVAGAAALTGRSFTEISDIFAGSAGTGKVTNQDLMQFATRGLNAAAALAKQWGITEVEVREMATNGEIDFKKFASAMDDAFGEHATTANKTFTGALANMRAAMSRLGASFIAPQLTNLRDIFNGLSPVIDNLAAALQPLMLVFTMITKQLAGGLIQSLGKISFSGLTAAMPAIVNGLAKLFGIFQKIRLIARAAFNNIFPSGFTGVLVKIGEGFQSFVDALDFGAQGASKLLSIFQGVFSILSIGWTVIKEGVKFLFDLGKALFGVFGGDYIAGVSKLGDFFTWLQEVLVKGGGIKQFFDGLREAVAVLVGWLGQLRDKLANIFGGFDEKAAGAVESVTGRIGDRFATLRALVDNLKGLWAPFTEFASKVADALGQAWEAISGFFDGLGERIASVLSSGAFSGALDALNTGLLAVLTAGIITWIKNGFNIGVGVNVGVGGGLIEKITGTFNELTNTLKTLQLQIKAEALLKIAYAVGILTASVLVLSLIDSAALTKALTAMAVGFAQLMGAFAILSKLALDPKTAASFGILSVGFILLGVSMLILAGAAKILASMSWEEIAKGLLGVTGAILVMTLATKLLVKNTAGMITAGAGMAALSVGLILMASAIKIFATMKLGDLAKGLIGLAIGLGIITLAVKYMPSGPAMALTGIGLVGIGIGLVAMGIAMKIFATMNWSEIGRGLVVLGGGLALIALGVYAMPGGMIPTGLGLIAIGVGLGFFATALKAMGSLSWDEIARGLTALAGSLIILSVGVTGMSGALLGAIALVVVSGALIILAGALKLFSKMSWGEITQGLLKLAAAIGAIALISVVLAIAVPFIIALGVALTIVGVAFAIFGAGAFLAAKAFQIVGESGAAGAAGIKLALESIGESLTALGRGLAKGIIETIKVFADGIGELIPAFSKIIGGLLTAMEKNLPKAMIVISKLLSMIIQLIYQYYRQFTDAGIFMLITMLQGIRDNIRLIVQTVSEIIVAFFDAMGEEVPKIITSLTDMIIEIMTSVVENLGKLSATLFPTLGIAFVTGFINGIKSNLSQLQSLFGEWPGKIAKWVGDALTFLYNKGRDIIQGLLNGINSILSSVSDFFGGLPGKVIGWIGDTLSSLAQKGRDLIQGLWNGITEIFTSVTGWFGNVIQWIKDKLPNPLEALKEVGKDLIRGFKNGLEAIWEKVEEWIKGALDRLPWIVKKALGIDSPSKVFMALGGLTSEGFFVGLRNTWDANVGKAFNTTKLINNINKVVQEVSNAMHDVDLDVVPVITPVLDLTQVAADAAKLDGYIQKSQKLVPDVSFSQARVIASSPVANQNPDLENSPGGTSGPTFQQIINSPTQLSTADIYKNTRNQITLAKEELAIK